MAVVEIGNAHPIQAVTRNGATSFERIEGERVTTFMLPDDYDLDTMARTVISTLPQHMDMGADDPGRIRPAWIQSSNDSLVELLCEYYEIPPKKNIRPATWGQEIQR